MPLKPKTSPGMGLKPIYPEVDKLTSDTEQNEKWSK
jgi:hypothetical protein